MKRLLLFLAVVAFGVAAQPAKPRVKRTSLEAMERVFDQKVTRIADDPFLLLGQTRGIYLEGFGAVFTAEVSLSSGPTINPFKQSITREEVAQVYARKTERLPILRERMREMMLASAASLDEVPVREEIVLAVRLLYRAYENTHGLPAHIQMRAQRGRLIDAQLKRVPLDQVLSVQEF